MFSPFKTRWTGRVGPGMLLTPDILKFKIPVGVAFVPVNPKYNPRSLLNGGKNDQAYGSQQQVQKATTKSQLLSASGFQNSKACQKQVQNFNTCLKNNGADNCQYYMSYLTNLCSHKS
jgi:hypothetical protein